MAAAFAFTIATCLIVGGAIGLSRNAEESSSGALSFSSHLKETDHPDSAWVTPIDLMRAELCFSRAPLVDHNACMTWLTKECDGKYEGTMICNQFLDYLNSLCREGDQQACDSLRKLGHELPKNGGNEPEAVKENNQAEGKVEKSSTYEEKLAETEERSDRSTHGGAHAESRDGSHEGSNGSGSRGQEENGAHHGKKSLGETAEDSHSSSDHANSNGQGDGHGHSHSDGQGHGDDHSHSDSSSAGRDGSSSSQAHAKDAHDSSHHGHDTSHQGGASDGYHTGKDQSRSAAALLSGVAFIVLLGIH